MFARDQEKVRQYESFMAQDNYSNDSLDPDGGDAYYSIDDLESQQIDSRGSREP
jgi:hypothetical protein